MIRTVLPVRARSATTDATRRSRRAALCAGVCAVIMMLAASDAAEAAKVKSTATTPAGESALAVAPKTAVPALPGSDHMVVEADEAVYDDKADSVTTRGNVTIYYKGSVLQARQVTYFRATRKVIAEGDARLTDKDGNVLTSPKIDVSDGFSEGFIDSLRLDTIDRSRFAAESAQRREGNVTVFEKGVYSACQTCVNEPNKPPFWQIKAARITHDQKEKTVYYEDAKLEMLGVPIAWVPYFQHPDPSERRKTGFLLPRLINSNTLGVGMQVPFYWAPTTDWDATFAPVAMSRQGVLVDLEVRKAFETGLVSVNLWGISQMHPEAFVNTSGDRRERGGFNTAGRFTIDQRWSWGWDINLFSDRRFVDQYHLTTTGVDRSISTVFLKGESLRSYFEARLYRFSVLNDDGGWDSAGNRYLWGQGVDLQNKQPLVHPVVDYDFVAEKPVAGGEVQGHFNFTSLSRQRTDIDTAGRVYGIAGTFSRVSGLVSWRRQFIDGLGQVFTPSASLRGDVFYNQSKDDALIGFVRDGTLARITPTLALDYAYPFIAQTTFGSHTFSPMAQLVVRPSEQWMGRLPNEDAQSMVFDDTNLFRADKFSGWDRAEGGTRLNAGGRYTFLAGNGGSLSALFGRSFLLTGLNSYADPGYGELLRQAAYGRPVPLTAFGSGLETNASDWVGGVTVDTPYGFRLGAQSRFDAATMRLARADVQASATSGPLSASVTWAYKRTPQVVYDLLTQYAATYGSSALAVRDALRTERSEIQTASNLRLTSTWRLFGGLRYNLTEKYLSGANGGIGYDNDSFSISLAYSESKYWTVAPGIGSPVHDQTVFLRFGFRTLGDGRLSNSLNPSN